MKHSHKIYIATFSLIIIILLIIVFVIAPIISSIAGYSEMLEEKKAKLASLELLAKNFDESEESYNFYIELLNETTQLLGQESYIDPEIPIEFINFFKDQADDLDLYLKITPFEEEEVDDFWNILFFRIEGMGQYSNFNRFLQKLEYGPWFVKAESLSLGQETVEEQEEVTEFNLIIKVYGQKTN